MRESSKAKVLNFYDQPGQTNDDNLLGKSLEQETNEATTEIIFQGSMKKNKQGASSSADNNSQSMG